MTGGQIKNIIKKRYRKLRKQFKKVKKLFDDEAIHQLRVEYKKLSAFLRLISHEGDASIRDLQVHQLQILEITKHEQNPLGIYSSVAAFKPPKWLIACRQL